MVRQWLSSRLGSARRVRLASARLATPAELRVHLPLLWPDGPDGDLDEGALLALGRDYARSGRAMDDLLGDLDVLCSVVGIGMSSRMIEASSVAWSDAFLDTVASPPSPSAALDEVERRLGSFRAEGWTGLAPTGRLLTVTWVPGLGADGRWADELGRVALEVRTLFPGAAVAQQPDQRRVVAAVADVPGLGDRVSALQARCAELVVSAGPTVTLTAAPGDADGARRLLGLTG